MIALSNEFKMYLTGLLALIFFPIVVTTGLGWNSCTNRFYCPNSEYPFAIHDNNVQQCCTANIDPQTCISNNNKYHCDAVESWYMSFYITLGCFIVNCIAFFIYFFYYMRQLMPTIFSISSS